MEGKYWKLQAMAILLLTFSIFALVFYLTSSSSPPAPSAITSSTTPTATPTPTPTDEVVARLLAEARATRVPTPTSTISVWPYNADSTVPKPTPTPTYVAPSVWEPIEEMVWIPNHGKRYHSNRRCSGMKGPSHVTISEAIDLGFTPCQNCYG